MHDDEVTWLSPQERDTWVVLLALTTKLVPALDQQLQRDAGLSFFEYMVLAGLAEQPSLTLRMSELAIICNGSLSRLSHVVRRLERAGLVRREPTPGDGRSTNAVLTEEGRERVAEAAPGHAARVRDLVFDALAPGQHEQLGEAGRRVLRRVDPSVRFGGFGA